MTLLEAVRKFPGYESATQEDVDRIFGTEEEQREEHRQFAADLAMLESDCIRDQYPNEWVRVYKGEVIAHAKDWRDILPMCAELGYVNLGYNATRFVRAR